MDSPRRVECNEMSITWKDYLDFVEVHKTTVSLPSLVSYQMTNRWIRDSNLIQMITSGTNGE